jgi:hypothetical protein
MNSQGSGGLRVHSHRLQDADIAEAEKKGEGVLTDSFVVDEYSRFLVAAKQDEKEAWKRIQETAAFREREKVDGLLEQPHPQFFLLKSVYSHGFLGVSKSDTGSYVLLDKMGKFHQTMKEFRKHGITEKDVMRHSMLTMEWFCKVIDPRRYPHGRFIRVYDFEGFKMQHVRDVGAIKMGTSIVSMIEKHYPERLEKAYVINAPPVLFHLWNIVKRMLDRETVKKFCIVKGKEESCALMQGLMEADMLPVEYGGTLECLEASACEKALYEHISKMNT